MISRRERISRKSKYITVLECIIDLDFAGIHAVTSVRAGGERSLSIDERLKRVSSRRRSAVGGNTSRAIAQPQIKVPQGFLSLAG